jgi:hypothetical protein
MLNTISKQLPPLNSPKPSVTGLVVSLIAGFVFATGISPLQPAMSEEVDSSVELASSIGTASVGGASSHSYGDFNGDDYDDLAVGVQREDIDAGGTGAVNVLYGSASGITSANDQFWHQDSPGIDDTPEKNDWFGHSVATGDFDRDGFGDLAVGVPGESIGGAVQAGAVNVLYGSSSGLSSTGSQFWTQDTSGIEDSAETSDNFGWTLAVGDFNGDGFDDLAVGVRGEVIGGFTFAGAVNVLYGSSSGLTASGDQFWHQNSAGVNDAVEQEDLFGSSLAAGDFDGDEYDDLAIGAFDEDISGTPEAGAVNVLYGSSSGLTSTGDQFWHQDSPGIKDEVELNELFGWSLAAGDFNGDGFHDLAVGVSNEDVGTKNDVGAVGVIYGSSSGLSSAGNQLWSQDSGGIADSASNGEGFARSVVAGDFDDDGHDDLAVGVPFEGFVGAGGAGAVNVLYGSTSGIASADNQFWHQNSPGIADSAEDNDVLGWAVAVGDFNGDGISDLVAGAPFEDLGSSRNAGAVHVIYGSHSGLSSSGSQFWHQNSPGVEDSANPDDNFGFSVG